MDQSSLQQAILDDPEDDAPRLVYADWLDANGQSDRAEWIRASLAAAKVTFRDPSFIPTLKRERDAWARCKPVYWEELKNIDQKNDRGLFRFILGDSRTARSSASIKRLSKATWLAQLMEQGWLQRIEAWADSDFAGLLSLIKDPVSRIPLSITAAPQIDDEGLRLVLALPQLQGLNLPSRALRDDVAKQIGNCVNLRDLTIEFRLVEEAVVNALLDRIVALPNLRKLRLIGHDRITHGTRPNDADVLRLAAIPALKRLRLSDSPAVTATGIAELQRSKPSLIVDR
jgi:uncharacterized protein (TIGR02996 family)